VSAAIVDHLIRHGHVGVAAAVADDTGAPVPVLMRSARQPSAVAAVGSSASTVFSGGGDSGNVMTPLSDVFGPMFVIARQVHDGNVLAALAWARKHARKLAAHRIALEFQLHQVHYCQLLQGRLWTDITPYEDAASSGVGTAVSAAGYAAAGHGGGRPAQLTVIHSASHAVQLALEYARDNFAPFTGATPQASAVVQRHMAAALYANAAGRPGKRFPSGTGSSDVHTEVPQAGSVGNGDGAAHVHVAGQGSGQGASSDSKRRHVTLGSSLAAEATHNADTVKLLLASPYADLFAHARLLEAQAAFIKARCQLLRVPPESPLEVTVTAGLLAMPALLKLAAVTRTTGGTLFAAATPVSSTGRVAASASTTGGSTAAFDAVFGSSAMAAAAAAQGSSSDGAGGAGSGGRSGAAGHVGLGAMQLPVEVPLPRPLSFHSVFVCPVTRQQCDVANPPVMLTCGHVISRESMQRLAAHRSRFKCPTCPAIMTVEQTLALQV
jgi:hypothetical protein